MTNFRETGHKQLIPESKLPGVGHANVPEFAGEHVWIITMAYRVDPVKMLNSTAGNPVLFDTENLFLTSSIGCFWCVQEYSLLVSNKRCPGDASPGWR